MTKGLEEKVRRGLSKGQDVRTIKKNLNIKSNVIIPLLNRMGIDHDFKMRSTGPWSEKMDKALIEYWSRPYINLTELRILVNGHNRTESGYQKTGKSGKTRQQIVDRAKELGLPDRFTSADKPGPHPDAEYRSITYINAHGEVRQSMVSVHRVTLPELRP